MSLTSELRTLSAKEALNLLHSRGIRHVEYVDALIDGQMASTYLNAFAHFDAQQLHDAAVACDDQKEAHHKGPLSGLPIALKDNIETAALPTTAGSAFLKDSSPTGDADAAAALFASGAILAGKTNMAEFAIGGTSSNATYGDVRNPWNLSLSPGGSSGGSGAAVAAGLVPVALGTDTGGSNRMPAAFTGCIGFRPTTGRYPSGGVVPLSNTLDTIGIFARTVEDIGLLDGVLAPRPCANANLTPGKTRIGIPRAYFYDDLELAIDPVITSALGRLADSGIELVEIDWTDAAELTACAWPILFFESLRNLAIYLARRGDRRSVGDLLAGMAGEAERALLQSSLNENYVSMEVYAEMAGRQLPMHRANFAEMMRRSGVDALAVPTAPIAAPPIGIGEMIMLDGIERPLVPTLVRNGIPAAALSAPCLTLPAGRTADGRPVGLDLFGLPGTDDRILAIGQSVNPIFPAEIAPFAHADKILVPAGN